MLFTGNCLVLTINLKYIQVQAQWPKEQQLSSWQLFLLVVELESKISKYGKLNRHSSLSYILKKDSIEASK